MRLAPLRWTIAGVALALAAEAAAFPTEDDQTPGTLAGNFKKRSNVWARIDGGAFDGKIKTSPPDSTTYDRRLETMAVVGGDGLVSQRFAARLNVKAEGSKRRVSAKEENSPVMDETTQVYKPALDLTFTTDKGLELFGGAEVNAYAKATRTEASLNGKTTTTFSPVNLVARRFGVTRRAGTWNGGFYYVSGVQDTRTVKTTVFDGTEFETKDIVFVPSRIGIFGDFDAGLRWDFDLAFVQARGKGPKDENGVTAYADSFEAKFGGLAMFGTWGLKESVFHKTLSYANNAFMTLETIPFTSFKSLLILGNADKHAFVGVVVGKGDDGQSLPEFNAKYDLLGFAATLGFQTPL